MMQDMSSPESRADVERYLRTDFLKALAHAMRSPLSVIGGSLSEMEAASPEEREIYAKMAKRNVAHLTRLATQFEWLAEIERGAVHLSKEACDTQTLVDDALRDVNTNGKKVEVTLVGSPAKVSVDAVTLRRALAMPIENACRFAKSKVCVEIDTREANHVAFHVSDDGPGFPDGAVDIIADRFRSAKERRARSDLALGLSLARSYVELNGGKLTLANAPGDGARCSLEIPKQR